MKPLKLTMQGFGSYIQKSTVDFDILGKNGLFLITGSTGGGKTTILDAMCFALYCKATGGRRSWEQMRSAGIPADKPTVIEFVFSNGADTYKFCRSRSMYMSRGKNRELKAKDEHSCYKLGENEWQLIESGSESRINEQAYRILGLDCEQFSKVIVLPQGEFRKLLLSSTKEKQAIFEKLFLTQKWSGVISRVKEKRDTLLEQLNRLTTQRKEIFAGEGVESADALEEKIKNTEQLTEQQRITADKTAEQIKALEKLIADIADIAATDKRLNECEHNIKQVCDEKAKADASYKRLEEECADIDRINRDISRFTERLALMNEQKKQAEKLQEYKKALVSVQKKLEAESDRRNELTELTAAKKKSFESLTKQTEEIQIKLNYGPVLITKLNELKKIDDDYKKLKTARAKQQITAEKASQAEDAYKTNYDELEALEHELNNLEHQKSQKMSSVLAQELRDNEPCPVCGSTEHPAPAHMCDLNSAELQKKIERIEKSLEQKKKSTEAANKIYIEVCTQKKAADSEAAELQKKCDGYNIYYRTVIDDIAKLEKQLAELKSLSETHTHSKQKLNALKEEISAAERQSEDVFQKYTAAKSECEITAAKIAEIEQSLPEGSKDADKIAEDMLSLQNKNIRLKRELEAIQTNFAAVSKKCTELDAKLKQLTETANTLKAERAEKALNVGTDDIGKADELKARHSEYRKLHEAALKQLGSLTATAEASKKAYARIVAVEQKFNNAETSYRTAARLADALSGKGCNTQKVQINAFVLCIMLDSIIMQANTYFTSLTNNRYRLSRMTEKSKGNLMGGLDIEIFDAFYGECRSVDTLSGGELFLASLSLALGLSDVVQGQSGGIHLDSIFIDEGFGSLDKETLDTAMKALITIKNMGRLVGIISHVSELKAMISSKITVISGKGGSTLKIEA